MVPNVVVDPNAAKLYFFLFVSLFVCLFVCFFLGGGYSYASDANKSP